MAERDDASKDRQLEGLGAREGGLATQMSGRILLVDDEPAIRMICEVNLEAAGFTSVSAANGTEALELAMVGEFQAVLLDVMMPGLDGWTVARELAANPATRDVPVVFLSARADPADRRQGYECGAVGYIVKPFDPLSLAGTLGTIIDRVGSGTANSCAPSWWMGSS